LDRVALDKYIKGPMILAPSSLPEKVLLIIFEDNKILGSNQLP